MIKSVYLISLGCDKNLVDGERMMGILAREGLVSVTDPADAHMIVINTCGFIESAVKEAIDHILKLSLWKKRGICKKLVVTGCMVQRYGKKLVSLIPEVDLFLGTNHYEDVGVALDSSHPSILISRPSKVSPETFLSRPISTFPSYAYVKISEGCSNSCSYCMIPKIRGPVRSRPIRDILQEVQRLGELGIPEIILIAQDVTSYGLDRGCPRALLELLEALELVSPIRWIRLLYVYPGNITEELLALIKESKKILPYLDIPFQHVSPSLLSAMGRKGIAMEPEKLLEMIRSFIPNITLRTTFMVGFPGEGEDEFNELLEFIERIEIDHVGAFAFSPERGTKAASFPNQVPERVKKARLKKLYGVQKKVSRKKLRQYLGKELPVIIDGLHPESDLLLVGRLPSQAPQIDGVVTITSGTATPGSIVKARITKTHTYDVEAEILE
ncbi:MAG: 30S ribosomal protein S12 methylthiotransferase RimO [Syntrophobacterales bacterium]|nr:30S ribosomal protein S12 methylthiotransferase RimO [Syntrophobacterales bacterium]